MRRLLSIVFMCVSMIGCLCINAGAVKNTETLPENCKETENVIVRASGSFNMSIEAHGKGTADKEFPLEAGEIVRIYATYSPDTASMDFGLIDPNGVFYYFNVSNGSIDKTIEIEERGNYTLAIRNNSGKTVQVSGFVKY